MIKKLLLILVILISNWSYSQRPNNLNKVTIKGKVVDKETSSPLEYATIVLKNNRFPSKVQGGITNNNGVFEIEIFPGKYELSIEYISFDSYINNTFIIRDNKDLGLIALKMNVDALENIDLIAERTEVEIRLDKRIYNVGKDITVRGGSISDVLDNIPSISVDIDGTLALRGNDNVRILINGKPSGLVGLAGSKGLQQLPAESIEKVEVITSPSARYDAEGTGGIINIILKKNSLDGFNGTIISSIGKPNSYGGSTNFNYRTGKVNFFNTFSFRDGTSNGNGSADNTYFNTPVSYLTERGNSKRQRNNLFTTLGAEYFISESSSILLSGFYSDSDNKNENFTTYKNFNSNMNLTSQSSRELSEIEGDVSKQLTLNYSKKYDTKGHELVLEVQFENSKEIEDGLFENQTIFPSLGISSFDKLITEQAQKRSLFQIDYVWPIDENTQFEIGYKGSFKSLSTDYRVSYLTNSIYVLDENQSNYLNYKENINAAYSQFGKKINKFSYLLGLRVENSNIEIDQRTLKQINNKNYTDWFPTVNLSYEFNEKSSLILGYSRRLRRPRSRFINPFPSRTSITNLFQGNPDINPSYSNSIDLGFLKRLEKFTINGSIYYTKSTSVFTFINEATGDFATLSSDPIVTVPVLRTMPINLSTNFRTGTEISLTFTPNRKFRINGNFNIFNSELIGEYNNVVYDSKNLSWFSRMNTSLKLPKDFDLQFRMFYRGPSKNSQSQVEGNINLSGGINKSLFNKKGTLSFRVSDILNTSKFKVTTTTKNYLSKRSFQRREPSYIITFTYKINENKSKRKRNVGQQNYQDDGGGDYGY